MKVSSRHKRANLAVYKRVGVLILLVLFAWLFPKMVGYVADILLTPATAVARWVRESNDVLPRTIRDRQTLIAEIQQLQHELAVQQGGQTTIRRLVAENTELRSLLGATTSSRIAAGIIARPNQLPYDLLYIDRGSKDGVNVGAPVYRNDDALLGVVVETHTTSAFVQLITSPEFRISAYLYGSNIIAPMEGMGGGVARIRLPQGINVRTGDLVVLPGINPAIIGEVASVASLPTQPDQYAYVVPPIALHSLRYVAVGLSPLPVLSEDDVRTRVTELHTQWLISQDILPVFATTSTSTLSDTEGDSESEVENE